MSTNIYLTDELSDISGYYRAKLNTRSNNPSIVQAVTNTVTNPATQPQITRVASASTPLQWLTDPLTAGTFTAATWLINIWALESNVLANTGLKFVLLPYTNAIGSNFLSDTAGGELATSTQNYNRTTIASTLHTITSGERLVIQIWLNSVGGSVSGYTTTISYNALYPYAEGDSFITCSNNITELAVLPQNTINTVKTLLKDADTNNSTLVDIEIIQAINSALDEYSRDRPHEVSVAYTGDGTSFDFSLPRFWIKDFSRVLDVEYPVVPSVQNRNLLDKRFFEIVQLPINAQPSWVFRFNTFTPDTTTNNFIMRYTTKHIHTTLTDTIPVQDFNAFCQLATAHAALIAKASYAATSDSTINADAVNYRDGTMRWESVAKSYRERYNQHMGINQEIPPSQVNYNWDSYFSWNQDRLTHPRRYR